MAQQNWDRNMIGFGSNKYNIALRYAMYNHEIIILNKHVSEYLKRKLSWIKYNSV